MSTIQAVATGIITAQNTVALLVDVQEKLHTDDHPFCNDLVCPCHMTVDSYTGRYPDYYYEYLEGPRRAGLLSLDEVGRIFHGDHI